MLILFSLLSPALWFLGHWYLTIKAKEDTFFFVDTMSNAALNSQNGASLTQCSSHHELDKVILLHFESRLELALKTKKNRTANERELIITDEKKPHGHPRFFEASYFNIGRGGDETDQDLDGFLKNLQVPTKKSQRIANQAKRKREGVDQVDGGPNSCESSASEKDKKQKSGEDIGGLARAQKVKATLPKYLQSLFGNKMDVLTKEKKCGSNIQNLIPNNVRNWQQDQWNKIQKPNPIQIFNGQNQSDDGGDQDRVKELIQSILQMEKSHPSWLIRRFHHCVNQDDLFLSSFSQMSIYLIYCWKLPTWAERFYNRSIFAQNGEYPDGVDYFILVHGTTLPGKEDSEVLQEDNFMDRYFKDFDPVAGIVTSSVLPSDSGPARLVSLY